MNYLMNVICSLEGHEAEFVCTAIDDDGQEHGNWRCPKCNKYPLYCTDFMTRQADRLMEKVLNEYVSEQQNRHGVEQ